MKAWHKALHPHELGLGCNSNLSPKSSWASPIQTPFPLPNLGLVPRLKSKPKVLMGRPNTNTPPTPTPLSGQHSPELITVADKTRYDAEATGS